MWSLPDIKRLNDEAAKNALTLEKCAKNFIDPATGEKAKCAHDGDEENPCGGELTSFLVFDIFSDDPKDVLFLCEEHCGYYGYPDEGYFWCHGCERTFIENYTWENYFYVDDGEVYCLNCYANRVINDPDEWISLDDKTIDSLTFDDIRKAKHIFAVEGPRHGLELVDFVTADLMTGGKVVGFSSATDSDDTTESVKSVLREAKNRGYKRALLVLDGVYQFAVDIAVYVDPKEVKRGRKKASV